jgi:hypothetical protein
MSQGMQIAPMIRKYEEMDPLLDAQIEHLRMLDFRTVKTISALSLQNCKMVSGVLLGHQVCDDLLQQQ